MAATELARILHAINGILDKASQAVDLPRRAALGLVVVWMNEKDKHPTSNAEFQKQFVQYSICLEPSAKKEASTAKSELLEGGFIQTVGKVSVFTTTELGRVTVAKINKTIDVAIDDAPLSEIERQVMRQLVGISRGQTPSRRPPKPEKPDDPDSQSLRSVS